MRAPEFVVQTGAGTCCCKRQRRRRARAAAAAPRTPSRWSRRAPSTSTRCARNPRHNPSAPKDGDFAAILVCLRVHLSHPLLARFSSRAALCQLPFRSTFPQRTSWCRKASQKGCAHLEHPGRAAQPAGDCAHGDVRARRQRPGPPALRHARRHRPAGRNPSRRRAAAALLAHVERARQQPPQGALLLAHQGE